MKYPYSKVISILLSHRKTVITPDPLVKNSPKEIDRDMVYLYHVAKYQVQLTSGKCSKIQSKFFNDVKSKFLLIY